MCSEPHDTGKPRAHRFCTFFTRPRMSVGYCTATENPAIAGMSQSLLEQAVHCHGQGRLAEAERLYLQVLAANPALADARHMLGVLKAQQGLNREAHDLIAPVVAANPRDVLARTNFSNVLRALGRHDE